MYGPRPTGNAFLKDASELGRQILLSTPSPSLTRLASSSGSVEDLREQVTDVYLNKAAIIEVTNWYENILFTGSDQTRVLEEDAEEDVDDGDDAMTLAAKGLVPEAIAVLEEIKKCPLRMVKQVSSSTPLCRPEDGPNSISSPSGTSKIDPSFYAKPRLPISIPFPISCVHCVLPPSSVILTLQHRRHSEGRSHQYRILSSPLLCPTSSSPSPSSPSLVQSTGSLSPIALRRWSF